MSQNLLLLQQPLFLALRHHHHIFAILDTPGLLVIQTFREFPKQLRGVILSSWEDWCESANEPGVTPVTFVTRKLEAQKEL